MTQARTVSDLVQFRTHAPLFEESLTAREKCVTGQPVQRTWHHYTSDDERFFAGEWEAEPGCWSIQYTEHEFCRIISGHSVLRDLEGREQHVRSGDEFVIPAGFQGQWEVLETTRKTYVIYQP